jgi:hypothetical protein
MERPAPRRRDVEHNHALDTRRLPEGHEEGGVAAPVVGDDPHRVQALGVEELDDVGRQRRLGVVPRRRVRPPPAAQVGDDHAIGLGHPGYEMTPGPPMLEPAVQQDERRPVARLGT